MTRSSNPAAARIRVTGRKASVILSVTKLTAGCPTNSVVARPLRPNKGEFAEQAAVFQLGIAVLDQTDGKGNATRQQFLQSLAAGADVDGQGCRRVAGVELAQSLVQQGADDVAGDGDGDMALHLLLHLADGGGDAQDGARDIHRLVIEQTTRFGQGKPPRLAVDQLPAQMPLQPFERAGDAGLLQPQLLRRAGDGACIGQHHESAQQVPIQIAGQFFGG
jgi:hypothetical protein